RVSLSWAPSEKLGKICQSEDIWRKLFRRAQTIRPPWPHKWGWDSTPLENGVEREEKLPTESSRIDQPEGFGLRPVCPAQKFPSLLPQPPNPATPQALSAWKDAQVFPSAQFEDDSIRGCSGSFTRKCFWPPQKVH
uniref:Uncharacterized protein n=1 Tax=Macaca fascicularis TaxID=9541 RepID=A0A7N9DC61_MACFA